MSKTYKMAQPEIPPLSWNAYKDALKEDWDDRLNRQHPPSELEVQSFLEAHPSMVPGAHGAAGNLSGHFPKFSALISQPPLPSYFKRVPDFMWIARDSGTDRPVLIEIESPAKQWFTKSGVPTAKLSHALNQIAEWKAWFNSPHNVQAFRNFYGLEPIEWSGRRFWPNYILIYGRRKEFDLRPSLIAKRAYLHADDIVSMTFDRLAPDSNNSEYMCVKMAGPIQPYAITVPPTISWSPMLAIERMQIDKIDAAIDANELMQPERKRFLVGRLPYWKEWARDGGRGVKNAGDNE